MNIENSLQHLNDRSAFVLLQELAMQFIFHSFVVCMFLPLSVKAPSKRPDSKQKLIVDRPNKIKS